MIPVRAKGIAFEGYYLNTKDLKIYSSKRDGVKEIKPIKKFKEKAFKLYQNGKDHVIKMSDIIEGLAETSQDKI